MSTLRSALAERVVVADGAMGTMLQASDATMDDFAGYEGCNEILNVTRPDIVPAVHEAYRAAGADCITTNSFGANLGNLGEYDLTDRIGELSEASARLARAAADRWAPPARPHDVPRVAGHVPAQRGGAASRRRRRADRRDLPGPAAGQGGHRRLQAGGGSAGPGLARLRAGHDRDDRRDAARQRDRRGADRPVTPRHRHDRDELRDRPG